MKFGIISTPIPNVVNGFATSSCSFGVNPILINLLLTEVPIEIAGSELVFLLEFVCILIGAKLIVFPIPSALGAFTGYKISYYLIQLLS